MQVSFLSLSLVMSSSYAEFQECHHCDCFVFTHLPYLFFFFLLLYKQSSSCTRFSSRYMWWKTNQTWFLPWRSSQSGRISDKWTNNVSKWMVQGYSRYRIRMDTAILDSPKCSTVLEMKESHFIFYSFKLFTLKFFINFYFKLFIWK